MTEQKCYQCATVGIDTPATIQARWVDAEGKVSEKIFWICQECYDAGNPAGPGYIKK